MKYQAIQTKINEKILHFQLQESGEFLSFRTVINLWQADAEFRLFYNNILKEIPFEGCFWENKGITKAKLDKPYEFVIIGTSSFAFKKSTPKIFASYYDENQVVSFYNLGRDARLVVPCPKEEDSSIYTHLVKFARKASPQQIDAFWQEVGLQYSNRINEKPVWLSTSGLGVYWLHVRIGDQPKYYDYTPYRILV